MTKTKVFSRQEHRQALAAWRASSAAVLAASYAQDTSNKFSFVSLQDAGLEENSKEPVFGGYEDNGETLQNGVFELVDWFYDSDSQSAEYCN